MHEPITWSALLRAYIAQKSMTRAEVARALGAWPSAVHYWCRGAKPRDPAVLLQIQRWSKGAIAADAPAQDDVEQLEASDLGKEAAG
ncbi:MAG: hypothetical protein EBR82_12280 [Caulobacteraceae bacterium]|nr:hypothetical protein [Caulobacteraceae bacterium]